MYPGILVFLTTTQTPSKSILIPSLSLNYKSKNVRLTSNINAIFKPEYETSNKHWENKNIYNRTVYQNKRFLNNSAFGITAYIQDEKSPNDKSGYVDLTLGHSFNISGVNAYFELAESFNYFLSTGVFNTSTALNLNISKSKISWNHDFRSGYSFVIISNNSLSNQHPEKGPVQNVTLTGQFYWIPISRVNLVGIATTYFNDNLSISKVEERLRGITPNNPKMTEITKGLCSFLSLNANIFYLEAFNAVRCYVEPFFDLAYISQTKSLYQCVGADFMFVLSELPGAPLRFTYGVNLNDLINKKTNPEFEFLVYTSFAY